MIHPESGSYLNRAKKVLPGFSSCYSRAPMSYARGSYPSYVKGGKGALLFDVDGKEYIDTTMGLCPVILGYSHPCTLQAMEKYAGSGPIFTLPHHLEVDLAERLTELIPCAQMARFGKNGADATSAAVRVAKAFTGRDHIFMCGYHGWHDWYIVTTDQNNGVLKEVEAYSHKFLYNSLDSLKALFEKHPDQCACVIMEAMCLDYPQEGFLEGVKELTHNHGALLIFDEIVTGFRWDLGGAQGYFKVTPDLAAFSKAMANGFPISTVVGKKEIMEHFSIGQAFWSTTYGNESFSMGVALDTLEFIEKEKVIPFIWEQGKKLYEGFDRISEQNGLKEFFFCNGAPPRHIQVFKNPEGQPDLGIKTLFQQECVKRGVITLGCHNLSFAHTDEVVEKILTVYSEVLALIGKAYQSGDDPLKLLQGPSAEPVFKRM